MTTKPRSDPFTSNSEFLDNIVAWLRVRFSRLEAERDLLHSEQEARLGQDRPRQNSGGVREARGLAYELAYQEKQVRELLDARLASHRATPDAPLLGILKLQEDLELSEDEMTLLLTLAIPAISPELSNEVLHSRGGFCGNVSIGELLSVLSPINVGDWLAARCFMRPSGKLARNGLVVIAHYHGQPTGTSLMSATVEISIRGLSAILADPEVEEEIETSGDSAA